MPMSAIGEYFYFLMVVSLYGAPVALLLLVLAWRSGKLRRALVVLVIAPPVIAGIMQASFQLSIVSMSRDYDATQKAIESWIGAGDRDHALDGLYLGTVEIRAGVPARHYRFVLPENVGDGSIEVWLPVDGAHQPGRLVLRPGTGEAGRATAPARLLLQSRTNTLNAAVAPARYFTELHPSIDRDALGPHTLIALIRPRSSAVIHPHVPPRENAWRYSPVELVVE